MLGHQVENSFLNFLQREYEELQPQHSSLEDDLHYGTDIFVYLDDVRIAVGITLFPSKMKAQKDAEKASKKFSTFIELFFDTVMFDESEDSDWQIAFNNAAEYLLNDCPKSGSHYLTVDNLSVKSITLN